MKKQNRTQMSAALVRAIKLGERQAYKIAWEADIHPATLSKLMRGAERVYPGDARVLRLARVVGVPEAEAFER